MTKTSLIRLAKAFVVSSVAVYTFINGPALYSDAQYWFDQVRPSFIDASLSGGVALIAPIILPVSDIQEQPLPSEATITIQKINVSVPIVFNVSANPDDIYKNLTNGMVHYSPTPKPGQGGAAVILCHSSLYPWQYNKYGAPCALIDKVAPGDKITVRYTDGRIFNFTMKQSIIFNPLEADGDKRLAEIERNPKPSIILVTCWPINTSKNRIALQAELE